MSSSNPWLRNLGAIVLTTLGVMNIAFVLGCSSADHEEAEHHDPEHFPSEFSDAVAKLQSYYETLANTDAASLGSSEVRRFSVDTWRWLPGLAAATDMSETNWDVVDRLCLEFENRFTNDSLELAPFSDEQKSWWQNALAQLAPLAQQYKNSIPQDLLHEASPADEDSTTAANQDAAIPVEPGSDATIPNGTAEASTLGQGD